MVKQQKNISFMQFIITYNIILLIPMMVISLSVFGLVRKQHYEKLVNEIYITMEKQVDYWKQQVSVITTYNTDFRYSKVYSRYESDFPDSYLDIINDLKQKESLFPFVERIYFYNANLKKVFTSGGTMGETLFFSKQCRLDKNLLEQTNGQGLAAGRAELYGGSSSGIVLLYQLSDPAAQDGDKGRYLLYTIRDEKLKEQFSQLKEEGITGITYLGKTIYSTSGTDLNEIEEKWYEAYYMDMDAGFNVWSILSKKEASKDAWIYFKSYGIWLCCSLLIGIILALYYSRKRYTMFQDLMTHNALLKGERNELRAESCLYELLSVKVEKGDFLWEKCLENGILLNRKWKYIIVFQKIKENEELNLWLEGLSRQEGCSNAYAIGIFENMCVYLVCSDEEREAAAGALTEFENRGAEFKAGEITENTGMIKASYEEIMREIRREQYQNGSYPKMELEALKEAAALGDDARKGVLLKELEIAVSEADEAVAVLVGSEVARLLNLDTEILYDSNQKGYRNAVRELLESALMKREMVPQKGEAADSGYRKKNIADVLTYMHEHYLDENFTVKYMAACFGTSISNLSHFFKKNMDTSISQYVDQLKLEKARELLSESDKKISEIAEILRYGNSTVFINMFKKYEGMTPKEYREKKRQG
ncbi:AraC-like DNA-binding protein [Hungatella effluvii]|uniref:AraC-like DNA-binding protein n=1 Tax=Hungatella effluvii TaxID=1096246 RepID=A0A2V3Y030_9FIRM|nr:AraC family transcriptional regulator [Hungatella effluvii]PXX51477.1 AraC-like DNA-binding protein [Hungatella effluvii]